MFEITTLPNEQKIFTTNLPFVNPYHAFSKKPVLAIKIIKALIKKHVHIVKKYVQAFDFNQHPIPSTSHKQFMTLQIPSKFPYQWVS